MELTAVHDLKPGDKLARNLYLSFGSLYIPANTVLDKTIIHKIKLIGIEDVWIATEGINSSIVEFSNKSERNKKILKRYKSTLDQTKNLVGGLRQGNQLKIDEINQIIDLTINNVEYSPDIISKLRNLKTQDNYTYAHSVNVSILCGLIGKWLKKDKEDIRCLTVAGLMHDMGKTRITLDILNKPSRLSEAEYSIMKKHSLYGYNICNSIVEIPECVSKAVVAHHERNDGSGYPFGLKSSSIHEFAKIISVADVYDAMTSTRPYKRRTNPLSTLKTIRELAFSQLDPNIVHMFIDNICNYLMGSSVLLNNGRVGEVVYINKDNLDRPLVASKDKTYNLSENYSLFIVDALS